MIKEAKQKFLRFAVPDSPYDGYGRKAELSQQIRNAVFSRKEAARHYEFR
jgi:hypothetical protein